MEFEYDPISTTKLLPTHVNQEFFKLHIMEYNKSHRWNLPARLVPIFGLAHGLYCQKSLKEKYKFMLKCCIINNS